MTTLISIAALASTLAPVDAAPTSHARAEPALWLLDASPPSTLQEDIRTGYVDVFVGRRSLDESAWAPIDEPPVLGFDVVGLASGGMGWELGVLLSYDSADLGSFDFDASIVELYGGLHLDFGAPDATIVPYIGLGLSLAAVESSGSSGSALVTDDDVTAGFYAHGGIAVPIGGSLRIGVDARILTGTDVELFGVGADVDYEQIAFFLGFGV